MAIAAFSLAVSVSVTSLVSMSTARPDDMCPTVVVAHRGYHENHAENTMPALYAAVKRGADVVEGDLRVSANDDLMLIHDGTLRRTTNGRGYVRHHTGPQIHRLRTAGGHRVPYILQFLRFVRRHPNIRGVLEVKSDRAVELLYRRLRGFGLGPRLTVSSMQARRLKEAEERRPHARRQLITTHRMHGRRLARFADWISLPAAKLSPGYVERMHEHGIRIQLRATSNRSAWDKAMRLGVDAISTDDVPELLERCRTRTWKRLLREGARGGS